MIQWENVHYQYQQGFLSQEHWATQLAMMKDSLPREEYRAIWARPNIWRKSFRGVVDQLYAQIDQPDAAYRPSFLADSQTSP